jgi:methionyl-tRNA synthetase
MGLARLGNKYFNDTEPWHTRKSNPQACANSIHVSLQICAALAIVLEPVMPFTAEKIRRMLRLEGVRSSTPGGQEERIGWDDAASPLLEAGHRLGEAEILFSKLEDDVIDQQFNRLGTPAQPEKGVEEGELRAHEPVKPEIVYDDFAKLDFRVGEIVAAEPVPKADRLLRLDIDLGFATRQVVAGIAEHFAPDDVVGRKVVVLVNLQPRKLRGLESQAMILMAEEQDGKLVFVETDAVQGSRVF